MNFFLIIDIILFIIVTLFTAYDFFFTLASFIPRKKKIQSNIKQQSFAIIYVAYKEDKVIIESIENFLYQDYPKDKYQVIVVSDQMQDSTNQALSQLPIKLLIANFEQSMKHKSLTLALEELRNFDKVIIMDADNITEINFLSRINEVTQNCKALQTHRTKKNDNTSIAIWDGIAEEINNTVFRKGHINIGLSAALIGSGMVFDFTWLKQNMKQCYTFAEDKELELLLATQNVFVDYANDIYVYDEKTSQKEILLRQRSRWFHAQILAFISLIKDFNFKKFNFNYIDKCIQWIPFPRPLRLILIILLIIISGLISHSLAVKWCYLGIGTTLTYLLAIPKSMYTKDFLISIFKLPLLFIVLIKSYIASLYRVRNNDMRFNNTPHSITKDE
ncbi:glycosyltransferase [Parabacteroides chinchillae]